MSDILFKTLITFLTVYGFVELVKDIFYCFTANIRDKEVLNLLIKERDKRNRERRKTKWGAKYGKL